MRKNDETKPLRAVAKEMGLGAATVFDIISKIKFKFERNKKLMFYFEDKDFDLENINL